MLPRGTQFQSIRGLTVVNDAVSYSCLKNEKLFPRFLIWRRIDPSSCELIDQEIYRALSLPDSCSICTGRISVGMWSRPAPVPFQYSYWRSSRIPGTSKYEWPPGQMYFRLPSLRHTFQVILTTILEPFSILYYKWTQYELENLTYCWLSMIQLFEFCSFFFSFLFIFFMFLPWPSHVVARWFLVFSFFSL